MKDFQDMMDEFKTLIEKHGADRVNSDVMTQLRALGYFQAPASTKYHGCYDGGLLEHSLAVANALQCLTDNMNLTWQRPDSPVIIGLFHDLCKADQYMPIAPQIETLSNGKNIVKKYEYRNTPIKGHAEKSIMLLSTMMTLTEEELFCIRYHMGSFSDSAEERSAYSDAIHRWPNVLFTHTADMIASQILGT